MSCRNVLTERKVGATEPTHWPCLAVLWLPFCISQSPLYPCLSPHLPPPDRLPPPQPVPRKLLSAIRLLPPTSAHILAGTRATGKQRHECGAKTSGAVIGSSGGHCLAGKTVRKVWKTGTVFFPAGVTVNPSLRVPSEDGRPELLLQRERPASRSPFHTRGQAVPQKRNSNKQLGGQICSGPLCNHVNLRACHGSETLLCSPGHRPSHTKD